MAILKVEGVTHWSIPVNDLAEAEEFYGELRDPTWGEGMPEPSFEELARS